MLMRQFLYLAVGVAFLSGCQSTTETPADPEATNPEQSYAELVRDSKPPAGPLHNVREGVIDPVQAVIYASQAGENGYSGTFGMSVRNLGVNPRQVYLNSELNYREQLNVSVRMDMEVVRFLRRTYGNDWLNEIVGKQIEVEGEAKREVIWFRCNDERTSSYYYQTHIHVSRPEQFKIL